MRFIHAADIHLDSPLRGLSQYPGAPVDELRGATRGALQRLVEHAIREEVDFVVLAGDLFDHDWSDFNTPLFLVSELRRLTSRGIRVVLIHGNHDSIQGMSKKTPWPTEVRVLNHKEAETVIFDELQVAIHGMSFPKRDVRENLVPKYPAPYAGYFNIGLLHTNVDGNVNHDSYAPCKLSELVNKGYQYWALGHVHDYQILHEHPHVVYSGNIQGRHIREIGDKGCVLVEVDGCEVQSIRFLQTHVLRWHQLEVRLDDSDHLEQAKDKLAVSLSQSIDLGEDSLAAVRVTFRGRCAAHTELSGLGVADQIITDMRSIAADVSHSIWLEKIRFETEPPLAIEELKEATDLVGDLLRSLQELRKDDAALKSLREEITPFLLTVAAEIRGELKEEYELDSTEQMQTWLSAAEQVLLSRILEAKS